MIHFICILILSVFADTCGDVLTTSKEFRAASVGLKAFKSVSGSLTEDELPVLEAAIANLGKHDLVFRKDRRGKDLARHLKIQKLIAEFNVREAQRSIYKIKRAIEERFSLEEYVKCK